MDNEVFFFSRRIATLYWTWWKPRGLDVLSVANQLAMTHNLVVNACVLIMRGKKWYFFASFWYPGQRANQICSTNATRHRKLCFGRRPIGGKQWKKPKQTVACESYPPKQGSTTKSKAAPFEAIDLSIYKPSAGCLAFSTSEDRLLLWIVPFQFKYYEITRNATDYTVI